jgi:hypothetical protein
VVTSRSTTFGHPLPQLLDATALPKDELDEPRGLHLTVGERPTVDDGAIPPRRPPAATEHVAGEAMRASGWLNTRQR